MNTDIILHPTEATPVPVTICPPAGKARKARKPRSPKPGDRTRDELLAMLAELRPTLKATTKHTKPEILRMLQTGEQVRAAAQDRENERRRAKRAAERAAKAQG